LESFLKKFNLRVTKQRLLILDVLKSEGKPVCYNEIKQLLAMDKATFYRNIEKLESAGAVTKLELGDGWYFELFEHKHSHFVCKTCNQIECVEHSPDLANYRVETALFKGVCKECG
jgi:Fur family ferric uptake transcriptional regulator